MKKRAMVMVVGMALLLVGCSGNRLQNGKKEKDLSSKQIQSIMDKEKEEVTFDIEGDSFSVDLIKGWQELDAAEVHEDASAALSIINNSAYYIVIGEPKEDFEDFAVYKELVTEQMMDGATDIQENEVERNGLKGTNTTFYQLVDGINFFYSIDILESKNSYIQSISWTFKSKVKVNENAMEQVMASIRAL